MTESLMRDIVREINEFSPITLEEIASAKLMNRIDSKFAISASRLPHLLSQLHQDYRVVEIDQYRICQYETLYYDTADLQLYKAHLGGRLNRFKVRQRSYVESRLSFTEVKFKNNKGRTIKNRIRIKPDTDPSKVQHLDPDSRYFLTEVLPLDPRLLEAVLRVDYQRITLVGHQGTERVTLDLNLSFHNRSEQRTFSQVVIAEVKQDKNEPSPFLQLMKNLRLREGSLSKYCLGIISLYPDVRYNRFKRKFNKFCRLNQLTHAHTSANTFPGFTSRLPVV